MDTHHEPARGPTAAAARLRGWSAIERHRDAIDRPARYRDLLHHFGLDPDACAALGTAAAPRLLYAEQAGCWLMLRDRARLAFVRRLAARLGAPDRWAVRALGADAVSDGLKSVLVELWLHPGFGRLRLMPGKLMRRNRRRAYRALPIDGEPRARLAAIFAGVAHIGRAIARGPEGFAEAMSADLRAGAEPGLRGLLPADDRPWALRRLGDELAALDAPALIAFAERTGRRVAEATGWAELWAAIDGDFLDAEVRPLDPLFDRFVTCVADPERAGRALAALDGDGGEQGVPLVGIVAGDGSYRIVRWHPDGLFWRQHGERRPIDWSTVRRLAAEGRTGGPAGVLEYLMLAATGRWLVIDDSEPVVGFQRVAAEAHRRFIGAGLPCVAFDMAESADDPPAGFWLLDAWRPDAEARIRRAVRWSMSGMGRRMATA